MLQKRPVSRARRPLALERLEDRLVLSGNVFAFLNQSTGQLFVVGDNGNNAFCINETTNLGQPTLTILGSPTTPAIPGVPTGNFTAVNSTIGGCLNVPLCNVSEIDVTLGNGTNFFCIGNTGGPVIIPGNINIRFGTGVDTISLNNIVTNAGIISIAPTPQFTTVNGMQVPANNPATLNVTETNIIAGADQITGGFGPTTVTQSNITKGFDVITTPGATNITIKDSRFRPPPRTWAIGQLTINADTSVPYVDNSVVINNINVGPSVINIQNTLASAGTATNPNKNTNTFTYDNSTIQFATVRIGSENPGSRTNANVEINNDLIVGTDRSVGVGLNVQILNESGVSGTTLMTTTTGTPPVTTPVPGVGLGSITTFNSQNVQFANGGDYSLRIDDGVNQANTGNNGFFGPMSTVNMGLVDTSGRFLVTLGDWFSTVQLGQGFVGLNDIDAGFANISIGNDNDVVVISLLELGDRFDPSNATISIGDVTPVTFSPPPSVLINGIWRDNDNGDDSMTILLGNNNVRTDLGAGWPITVSMSVGSNLTIAPQPGKMGNGWNLTVTGFTLDPNSPAAQAGAMSIPTVIVPGTLSITMGNGGAGNTETLTLNNVTAGDVNIQLNSNSTQVPDTATFGAFINLNQVNVTDPYGGLNLTDIGTGVDIASFLNVNVAEMLSVVLANSGLNVLSAQNVTTCFGNIDGGMTFGSLYVDLGGNFGYTVTNFIGH